MQAEQQGFVGDQLLFPHINPGTERAKFIAELDKVRLALIEFSTHEAKLNSLGIDQLKDSQHWIDGLFLEEISKNEFCKRSIGEESHISLETRKIMELEGDIHKFKDSRPSRRPEALSQFQQHLALM